jgi:hypothetical protein
VSRPEPPGGAPPPAHAFTHDDTPIDLLPLAQEICARYRHEFPDEEERYGPAGMEWCLHDNQYLLAWAIQDTRDATVVLSEQATWLAAVLNARDFPIARLARDLEIAAEVLRTSPVLGDLAQAVSENLAASATTVAELPASP